MITLPSKIITALDPQAKLICPHPLLTELI